MTRAVRAVIEQRMTGMDRHFPAAYLVLQQREAPPHVNAALELAVALRTAGATRYNQLAMALFAANTANVPSVPNKLIPQGF